MKGSVEKEHRIVKPTRLRPSHQAYRRPRSENPRPLRHCGLRLTLAARRRRSRRARLTLGMGWFGWASRPLLRPLLGARRTSWQATMGGTAYRDHRKAAGRAADARRPRGRSGCRIQHRRQEGAKGAADRSGNVCYPLLPFLFFCNPAPSSKVLAFGHCRIELVAVPSSK